MAQHLYTFVNPCVEKHLDLACEVLRNDGVIAYPTDVNWAFGCSASSRKALDKIRQLKPDHPDDQPFSLFCSSLSMVARIANVENHAYRVLRKILPGPYTILLKSNRTLPKQIGDKRATVGVRVPKAPLLLELMKVFETPLATTSLPQQKNASSSNEFRFGYEIEEHFGHALDLILDLGQEIVPRETTILDMCSTDIEVVRKGEGNIDGLV